MGARRRQSCPETALTFSGTSCRGAGCGFSCIRCGGVMTEPSAWGSQQPCLFLNNSPVEHSLALNNHIASATAPGSCVLPCAGRAASLTGGAFLTTASLPQLSCEGRIIQPRDDVCGVFLYRAVAPPNQLLMVQILYSPHPLLPGFFFGAETPPFPHARLKHSLPAMEQKGQQLQAKSLGGSQGSSPSLETAPCCYHSTGKPCHKLQHARMPQPTGCE
jgi:hypothetical protein